MKNIQVIDGADNCAYLIYALDDDNFRLIFPGVGQDVEFVDDFIARTGKVATKILQLLWTRPVEKTQVVGIHGTLFYKLDWKKPFYPTKREADFDDPTASGRRAGIKTR